MKWWWQYNHTTTLCVSVKQNLFFSWCCWRMDPCRKNQCLDCYIKRYCTLIMKFSSRHHLWWKKKITIFGDSKRYLWKCTIPLPSSWSSSMFYGLIILKMTHQSMLLCIMLTLEALSNNFLVFRRGRKMSASFVLWTNLSIWYQMCEVCNWEDWLNSERKILLFWFRMGAIGIWEDGPRSLYIQFYLNGWLRWLLLILKSPLCIRILSFNGSMPTDPSQSRWMPCVW